MNLGEGFFFFFSIWACSTKIETYSRHKSGHLSDLIGKDGAQPNCRAESRQADGHDVRDVQNVRPVLEPVEPRAVLVNLRSPYGPVPEQVVERLATRLGAEVYVVAYPVARHEPAAVGPEVQRIEVLMLREVVCVWYAAESRVLDLGSNIGAVNLGTESCQQGLSGCCLG